MKTYIVTGTFHGSYVYAQTEGEARRIFHKAWNGESIIHIKVYHGFRYP
jgi:hypothetical protein